MGKLRDILNTGVGQRRESPDPSANNPAVGPARHTGWDSRHDHRQQERLHRGQRTPRGEKR